MSSSSACAGRAQDTKHRLPLEPLTGEVLKSAPGKTLFLCSCSFRIGRDLVTCPSPCPGEQHLVPEQIQGRDRAASSREAYSESWKKRLEPPISRRGEHSCVGSLCLSLESAALLPRKEDLRNCLAVKSKAGKMPIKLMACTEVIRARCTQQGWNQMVSGP